MSEYPRPAVTVDLVLRTDEAEPRVLLIRRAHAPEAGKWALPGGFLDVGPTAEDQGEDLIDAARRELHEETGLSPQMLADHAVELSQIGAWGTPGRDPRMRVITIAYAGIVPAALIGAVQAGDDAADARWWPVEGIDRGTLAFDHRQILEVGLAHLRPLET